MTLHQAIEQILQETERPMSSEEIAAVINERGMYFRQDGASVPAVQISGRVNSYENIFTIKGRKIWLGIDDPVSLKFEKYRGKL